MDPMASHLRVDRYGDFWLTDAVRPAPGLPVTPRQGYRPGVHRDRGARMPLLAASVSRENLFEVFLDLLQPLGEVVHVVLETSHASPGDRHDDLTRTDIDLPVLASHFCEYEDLLLNDGCTGVAVLSADRTIEVQFDEHKELRVYARNRRPFRRILKRVGVLRDDDLTLLSEAPHLHCSRPEREEEFRELCYRVGVGDMGKVLRSGCDD